MEKEFLPLKIIFVFKGLPIINGIFEVAGFCKDGGLGQVNILGDNNRDIISYCMQNLQMFLNVDCQERASAATSYSAMSVLVSSLLKFPAEIFSSSDLTTLSRVFLRVMASLPLSSFQMIILVLQRSHSL
jgi:hypothetical protein